jgi:hypothetical protein
MQRWALVLCITAAAAAPAWAQRVVNADTVQSRMSRLITVDLHNATASDSLQWFAKQTGFNLLINWDQLQLAGYDPQYKVNLQLRDVPATTALKLLMMEIFNSPDVIAEVKPDYLRIMTTTQANAEPVIRVYDVGEMLHEVPDFTDAPTLDLNQTTTAGGGGGGQSPFQQGQGAANNPPLTRNQRAQQLIDAIENSIAPDIWDTHGGSGGRITFYDGRLIVVAPEYVQQQIGGGEGLHEVGRSVGSPGTWAAATASSASPLRTGASAGGVASSSTLPPSPLASVMSNPWAAERYRELGRPKTAGIDHAQAK